MKIYYLIGILLICSSVNAQGSKFDFKDQREQENYWAREKFEKEYKKEIYKRYGSHIEELDTITYKYDSQIFKVAGLSNAIRQLFTLGILYPSLIANKPNAADSLKDGQKIFKNPFQTDTIYIYSGSIEELRFLEVSPKIKRFRLWLRCRGISNPLVYLFELTNEKATKQTNMENFIKSASLTFFRQGWIVI